MRAATVRLTAVVFALALMALAAVAAWLAQHLDKAPREATDGARAQASSVRDGRALYARNCERCHTTQEFAEGLHGPQSGARVLEMLEFLEQHGDGDELDDRAVLAFLVQASR